MKLYILILFSSICLKGIGQESAIYSGELCFKLITAGNLAEWEDEKGRNYFQMFDTLNNIDHLSKEEKELKVYYDFIVENGLFGFSTILYKNDQDVVFTVFLDSIEYMKVKDFKLSDLRKKEKKVLLIIKGIEIRDGVIKGSEIVSCEILSGSTSWSK